MGLGRRCIVSLLVAAACASTEPPVADAPRTLGPTDLKITLERTTCFGSCPAYFVSVDARGDVEWEGRAFVEQLGRAHARLDSLDGLAALFGRLDAVDYDALPSLERSGSLAMCPSHATDHPTVIVTVVANGTKRSVDHDLGCRGYPPLEAFEALEREIDAVARTEAWIGRER